MITATHIDTAFAELHSAMRSYQEWAQLLAEAKHTLETAKRQGLAQGTSEGQNPELREAAATTRRPAFTVGDTVLLDGRWACEVLGFNWNYQEVLLRDPEGYHGWAVVTRLTLLREAGAP